MLISVTSDYAYFFALFTVSMLIVAMLIKKISVHNKRVSQQVMQELVLEHLETVLGDKQNRKTASYEKSLKRKVLLSEGRFST